MAGNVMEWCQDLFSNNYQENPQTDPVVTSSSYTQRVIRGGGWFSDVENCRSARRSQLEPSSTSAQVGFRLVLPGP